MSETTETLGIDPTNDPNAHYDLADENEVTEQDVADVDVPFEIPEGYRLMSDDEATELAKSLVKDHRKQWEIQEIVDNAIAAGQMNDMMRSEFLYEYDQGNRTVRGLSAKMIIHLATARGASEVIDKSTYTETEGDDGKYEFDVVVEMPDPFNPKRMLTRRGFAEASKIAFGKPDPFAKQKAHTKAFRNACLKLLPQDLIIATIYKLAKLVPADWQPQSTPKESDTDKAMKRCFATYGKHEKDILENHSVSRQVFGDAIRVHYDVGSRKDLTAEQWDEIRKSLETEGYGDVVKSIIDIAKEGIPF